MDARIAPHGSFGILSRQEVSRLLDAGAGGLYGLWRQCSLAVLNAGAEEDDIKKILERNQSFELSIVQQEGGIALELQERARECVRRRPDHPRYSRAPVRRSARPAVHA